MWCILELLSSAIAIAMATLSWAGVYTPSRLETGILWFLLAAWMFSAFLVEYKDTFGKVEASRPISIDNSHFDILAEDWKSIGNAGEERK